jgi:hypothetical protein
LREKHISWRGVTFGQDLASQFAAIAVANLDVDTSVTSELGVQIGDELLTAT